MAGILEVEVRWFCRVICEGCLVGRFGDLDV
jgi:hypothetical protein